MEDIKFPEGIESPALHTHLTLLQGVINRMAKNSALCKAFGITLASVVAAVAASGSNPDAVWTALVPILIFAFLDVVCISLERGFREKYNNDVGRFYEGTLKTGDLFRISPPDNYRTLPALREAAKSWAIWGIYPPVLVLLILVRLMLG